MQQAMPKEKEKGTEKENGGTEEEMGGTEER